MDKYCFYMEYEQCEFYNNTITVVDNYSNYNRAHYKLNTNQQLVLTRF